MTSRYGGEKFGVVSQCCPTQLRGGGRYI